MDPFLTVSALASGVGSLFQLGKGIGQKAQAKKLARSNPRPNYDIPQPYYDVLNFTESLASEGMTDSAKQAYLTNAERGLTSSIDAVLKSGGSPNLVSSAYDNYEQGISKMAIQEDKQRLDNIKLYMDASDNMAAQLEKQWQINKYAPYADKAQLAAKLSEQGAQNISGGIGGLISAGTTYMQGKENASSPTDGTSRTAAPSVSDTSGGTLGTRMSGISLSRPPSSTTQFISPTGFMPSVSSRSANNMSALGMRYLGPLNMDPRGVLESGMANPYRIDLSELYLNSMFP